jgi:hypothetical protein
VKVVREAKFWSETKINKPSEAQNRDVRRSCAGCYEKIRQQNQEKQVMRQQKNKVFCSDCDKKFLFKQKRGRVDK